MTARPISPVPTDEKEAEDKEEEEKEEVKIDDMTSQQKLYYFCKRGDVKQIRSIARSGDVDINGHNEETSKTNPYRSRNTALHYAVVSGSLEAVQMVFGLEANLESKNKLKSTPLHLAASLGYAEIVEFLLSKKADAKAVNLIQNTPLHCAVYAGHVDAVRCLLEHCDDPQHALLFPTNGIGFGSVKYTSHDEMKAFLRQYFPKRHNDDGVDEEHLGNGLAIEEEDAQAVQDTQARTNTVEQEEEEEEEPDAMTPLNQAH